MALLEITPTCEHDISEQDVAAQADGLCPLCLSAQNEKLRAALEQCMRGGNHLATYKTARWPEYKLDGLTREEQAENALRILGATREYDMWCCWSAIMQARDFAGHQ